MKQFKSLFKAIAITSCMIMMSFGTVYGAMVTMQREGAPQSGQESTVLQKDVNIADNQLKLTPRKIKDKNHFDMESDAGNRSIKMEQYKPYVEGEGERKKK